MPSDTVPESATPVSDKVLKIHLIVTNFIHRYTVSGQKKAGKNFVYILEAY